MIAKIVYLFIVTYKVYYKIYPKFNRLKFR